MALGEDRDFAASNSASGKHLREIPYFKELGITAVELLPVQEFNANDLTRRDPMTGEAPCNYWGHNTAAFFAPQASYASDAGVEAGIRHCRDYSGCGNTLNYNHPVLVAPCHRHRGYAAGRYRGSGERASGPRAAGEAAGSLAGGAGGARIER